MNILIFLIILAVLILVHEFGHFIVAKRSGVRVDEFGLGFPPKLFGFKRGETTYTFNLIPFGGFVKIFGENPDEESLHGPDRERSFVNKPKYTQVAIISAGVFFNILLAWVLISIGFMSGLPTPIAAAPKGAAVEDVQLVITGIQEGSPAQSEGLRPGDQILLLQSGDDLLEEIAIPQVQSFIAAHGDEEVMLQYKRGKNVTTATLIPTEGIIPGKPAIGISMDMIGIVALPPHRAVWEGAKMTIALTGAVVGAFAGLIADAFTGEASLSNLTGPVGIVGLVGDAAEFGFIFLLGFTAFISINLAVINLIPFPALDGGRLLFLVIEAVKGSSISPKIANFAHAFGFALLILLMLVVTYNDVVRLIAN